MAKQSDDIQRLFTGKEFIEAFRGDRYKKIQIRKLIFVARRMFGLDLDNVYIFLSTDPKWNTRKTRTPLERKAERVGHSCGFNAREGHFYQYALFCYPAVSVKVENRLAKRQLMRRYNGHERTPYSSHDKGDTT